MSANVDVETMETEHRMSTKEVQKQEHHSEKKFVLTREHVRKNQDGSEDTHRDIQAYSESEALIMQRETEVVASYRTTISQFRAMAEAPVSVASFLNWAEQEAPCDHPYNILETKNLEEVYSLMEEVAQQRVDRVVAKAQKEYDEKLQAFENGTTDIEPRKKPVLWTDEELCAQAAEVERALGTKEADKFATEKTSERNESLNWEITDAELDELGIQIGWYGAHHKRWPDGVVVTPGTKLTKELLEVRRNVKIPVFFCTLHDQPRRLVIDLVPVAACALHAADSQSIGRVWQECLSKGLNDIPTQYLPKGLINAREITRLVSGAMFSRPRRLIMDMIDQARSDPSFVPPSRLPREPVDDPELRKLMEQVSPLMDDPDALNYLNPEIQTKVAKFSERAAQLDQEHRLFARAYNQLLLTRASRLEGKPYMPVLDSRASTSHEKPVAKLTKEQQIEIARQFYATRGKR